MKARLVVFLGLMLGCLSTMRAEVVIYRGTVRTKSDRASVSFLPVSLARVVLVVNYDTHEFGSVIISKKPGQKKYQAGEPGPVSLANAALKGGKFATMLVGGTAGPSQPDSFSHVLFSFRGTNVPIKVRRVPAVIRIHRPKAITGKILILNANAGIGRFVDQSLSTTFQELETLKANDAGKTAAEVIADITADLESRGYTSF